jgi:hypothetical protein
MEEKMQKWDGIIEMSDVDILSEIIFKTILAKGMGVTGQTLHDKKRNNTPLTGEQIKNLNKFLARYGLHYDRNRMLDARDGEEIK